MSHRRFRCSSCDKVLQIDESYSGQSIQCPSCQAIVQAPLKQSAPSEKLPVPPKPASKPVSSANRRLAPPKPDDQIRDDFASSPLSQSTYQTWDQSEALFKALQAAGKDCTFETVPHGDHFQSMIDVGIPKGIECFKK